MSDKEQYGQRDLTYSQWHRWESTKRFLSDFEAWKLGMVDIDDVEYCRFCYQPLALIETAMDKGQTEKGTTITRLLAESARVPAYVCFYQVSTPPPQFGESSLTDIGQFRITSLASAEYNNAILTPQEYAEFLLGLREEHEKQCHKINRFHP